MSEHAVETLTNAIVDHFQPVIASGSQDLREAVFNYLNIIESIISPEARDDLRIKVHHGLRIPYNKYVIRRDEHSYHIVWDLVNKKESRRFWDEIEALAYCRYMNGDRKERYIVKTIEKMPVMFYVWDCEAIVTLATSPVMGYIKRICEALNKEQGQ